MNTKEKARKIKEFFTDLFFPKFCFGCGRENQYLCEDCKAILEISPYQYCLCGKYPKRVVGVGRCPRCLNKKLNGLYFALNYQNALIRELIKKFKYSPFAKELSKDLTKLIIEHLLLSGKEIKDFSEFLIVAVPLDPKRKKWRGFNQAEEIAKELSDYLNIPLITECLIKTKKTLNQAELDKKKRMENIRGALEVQNSGILIKRKILLVDDVYTTGATLEEGGSVLKKAGAKEVWGMAIARELI